ncbi:4-phosphoerythronate dehydrogenase [Alteromonadaceae bacterium M269]|nr:4-phosphoerythronate dehydrogenase [Alteromonadaceae bacterium M269]
MNIFYEDTMPYALEHFRDWGNVQSFNHKTIKPEDIVDADLLFVRSTTKVDEYLVGQCRKLKFVATATSGSNHVDIDYLKSRNIGFASAAGSNAIAVAEYVVSAILVMAEKLNWQAEGKTVGVVGAGQVGTQVERKLSALGMDVRLCDPPLEASGDTRNFVSLEEVMTCDVITLHVPLVRSGEHPTLYMFDHDRLQAISEKQVLINAARGEVVDNQALLNLLTSGKQMNLVFDVWENEPDINFQLVPYIDIATAHIAGHTIEGKAKGTSFVYRHAAKALELANEVEWSSLLPKNEHTQLNLNQDSQITQDTIRDIVFSVYDIRDDDAAFRQQVKDGDTFRYYRKNYPIRREFASLQVNAGNLTGTKAIYELGFSPFD